MSINYKNAETVPVEVKEKATYTKEELDTLLTTIAAVAGCGQLVVYSHGKEMEDFSLNLSQRKRDGFHAIIVDATPPTLDGEVRKA
jgi:hypothetical protein